MANHLNELDSEHGEDEISFQEQFAEDLDRRFDNPPSFVSLDCETYEVVDVTTGNVLGDVGTGFTFTDLAVAKRYLEHARQCNREVEIVQTKAVGYRRCKRRVN